MVEFTTKTGYQCIAETVNASGKWGERPGRSVRFSCNSSETQETFIITSGELRILRYVMNKLFKTGSPEFDGVTITRAAIGTAIENAGRRNGISGGKGRGFSTSKMLILEANHFGLFDEAIPSLVKEMTSVPTRAQVRAQQRRIPPTPSEDGGH